MTKVFLSHTAEFAGFPEPRSFVDAAVAAIVRAGAVPCDMGYFSARDQKPAEYCREQVRACDVYVGLIGHRYGSPVRDRPEVSYTELEFDAASEDPAKTRLIFLLDQNAVVPVGLFSAGENAERQAAFRTRLRDAGLIVAGFGDAAKLELLVYQALKDQVEPTTDRAGPETSAWPADKSPYPGLMWFDQDYAPLFFGRDREVDALLAKMSQPGGRFVVVTGASGSGKSSLVGGGIWRALIRDGRLPGSRDWSWLRIQPGDGTTPVQALAWGLKQALPKLGRPDAVADELAAEPERLGALLAERLDGGRELVLFVDQMEELFTTEFESTGVGAFVDLLVAATGDEDSGLRVVATLRTEFLVHLEPFPAVLERINAGFAYNPGPVSPRALQDMIEQPALATGYEFEPGLVEDMLADARQEPGHLPLVAYALQKLFERRSGRTFTREAYRQIGGVAGAIGTKADEVMAGLDEGTGAAFDRVLAELVHLERDGPPARRRAALAAFDGHVGARGLIDALAASDCRILITDEKRGRATVEVAHEKLFTAWPRLADWIEAGRDDLRLIEHAREEAIRWAERGHKAAELWTYDRVDEVKAALKRFGKGAGAALDAFLNPGPTLVEQLDRDDLTHSERALIGIKLAGFGDPRPGVGLREDGLPDILWSEPIGPGMVELEGHGGVLIEKPFRLAVYAVTNAQFAAFHAARNADERWWDGVGTSVELAVTGRLANSVAPAWKHVNHPRETVSWYEAVAFCFWLTAKYRAAKLLDSKAKIRLPSEAEWQLAATGGDPTQAYPWGDWDASCCNSVESGLRRTTAVGVYPCGASRSYNLLDLSGNVWEWCANPYDNPHDTSSIHVGFGPRALRGGSWLNEPQHLRSTPRAREHPDTRNNDVGFRLAQELD